MEYVFDEVINRKGTNSLKYDFMTERGRKEDVLPLWVADMDFQTAPEIVSRLKDSISHGIYGYSESKDAYFEAVIKWYQQNFDWEIQKNWIIKTPGVVFALAMAVQAFTKEGDAVLIEQPVYYPFSEVILDNNRRLVSSDLLLTDGKYKVDFDDFEKKIIENDVKLFILCSPHNPVGRVWTKDELIRMGDICIRHGVKVVSDEIHSDFTYEGYTHRVFASLGKEYADISVICTAPTKTFNLAGLQISNIVISNKELRKLFKKQISRAGYSQVGISGLVACQAAYEEGGDWLIRLRKYLAENLSFVRDFLKENLPKIKLVEPEGTYLVWLDFRELKLTEKELEHFVLEDAKLWLDSGAIFGAVGEGFERINIACPRKILKQALLQLKAAYEKAGY